MTTPALSILLPTYDGEAHLAEQLDSILGQDWDDFELLIVDDGSSDGTPALLEAYAARDRRIRIVPSAGNLGQKARLAQLVGEARGALISVSDQDDVWHAQRTRRLIEGLGAGALSYGRSELTDGEGRPMGRTLIENFGAPPDPADRLALLFIPRVSGHAMVVRREAVADLAFRRFQPFDWLIALDALFSAGIAYVDEAIVYHRLHGANQNNGAVGQRVRGLQRWRPGRIYAELQSTRRWRYNLLERLEHLAYSEVIEPATRQRFARIAARCRWCWFEPGTGWPFADAGLRAEILEALKPLAGSERDWAVAVDHVTGLTRSQIHPASLYRSSKLLFWY